MIHFNDLKAEDIERIFYIPPEPYDSNWDRDTLSYALGATLYMPAHRPCIANDLITNKYKELTSMVICLEDAIGDHQVVEAEEALLLQLQQLESAWQTMSTIEKAGLPLIFLRLRSPEQFHQLIEKLMPFMMTGLLHGFVFPKFSLHNGEKYLQLLRQLNRSVRIYGMPIFETRDIMYKESRIDTLLALKALLGSYKEMILNIRIGATDFSSLFGIRRSPDLTLYDIVPMKDCIGDIVNVFGRIDDPYVLSGPVWEYFPTDNRVLKPKLREAPFERYGHQGLAFRRQLITRYIDGLIREILLDQANGLCGKTVIHPSHIRPVNALQAVTYEEYCDATTIVSNNDGKIGVMKSAFHNKMNEIKPHLSWAKKIITRSCIYGVLNETYDFTSLLGTEQYDKSSIE
ncbi:HpcH/HpaI aldolase/citrate lyase family protein [Heliorestis acidaminivorans]|uniref:HpcH/HpaI aldolase/citrate lyase family protein n=1 Tax=Heliorestis acidaminivorans TaxID=553427 RepID=A0A6I0F5N3_9FIRM|nr:HpcH/HpaI aldolase/citrate lyase family protein [Heliorestis acidaminivorans]KAB2952609.1 HpcH/HpaI aldolase/citrate lyase family protein [Heliorestis acidaminivorans]